MANFVEKIFGKIFGNKHEKDIKKILPIVDEINAEYEKLKSVSNDELRGMTSVFREEIKNHLQEIEGKIEDLQKQIESNPDMDIDEKELVYDQIDELKLEKDKQRNLATF
jgi:preprotein translocase subunit SecA